MKIPSSPVRVPSVSWLVALLSMGCGLVDEATYYVPKSDAVSVADGAVVDGGVRDAVTADQPTADDAGSDASVGADGGGSDGTVSSDAAFDVRQVVDAINILDVASSDGTVADASVLEVSIPDVVVVDGEGIGDAHPIESGVADTGSCTTLQLVVDPLNCGTCGHVCPTGPNATPTCTSGTCGITCTSPFVDCDGDPTNGCEVNLTTTPTCCGTTCATGETCVNVSGTYLCVSTSPPPCATTVDCPAGLACVAGACACGAPGDPCCPTGAPCPGGGSCDAGHYCVGGSGSVGTAGALCILGACSGGLVCESVLLPGLPIVGHCVYGAAAATSTP